MKAGIIFTITLAISFLSLIGISQERTIQGTVLGINGALEQVAIIDLSSKIKIQSNASGKFSLTIPSAPTQLRFTYKKMQKVVLVSEFDKDITVTLIPSDKKLYKELCERQEIRLCDIYTDHYPKGKYTNQVNQLKEKLFFIEAYNIAASQFTDTALQNYLLLYPQGIYRQKALDAIEIAAWQKARFNHTAKSYQEYLNQYPEGKAAKLAKEKLAEFK
ncbi:MAG: hypothetical protein AB7E36_09830 [Salinivirgaceae bacterium]